MAKSPVNHILVLVDGTDSSYNAADVAIELARSLGAKLTAMAVVDTDTLRQLLSVKILVDAEMGEFEKELEQSSRRQLAEVCRRALDRKVLAEEVLLTGNTETVVPREVQQRGVDLIALGGFQSSQVTRDLLARQRQQIIDRSVCPVLVVK
ncbi:MAG TPA: universal stress protein [Phycisphaerae bacterium]|nr:universal stress protein [Phycisphaerae bacterium]